MESKKDIRERVLKKRISMAENEWEEKSRRIFEKVVLHPYFLEAKEIYCYVDYKREVGTSKILKAAWMSGKKVAVPKVVGKDLQFFYTDSFQELRPGYCGILEPDAKKRARGKEVLVILPGAAFDHNRNRIGYGKGFYDRYLSLHQSYRKMALSFELQMADAIPHEIQDVCPDIIVTEERIYV